MFLEVTLFIVIVVVVVLAANRNKLQLHKSSLYGGPATKNREKSLIKRRSSWKQRFRIVLQRKY